MFSRSSPEEKATKKAERRAQAERTLIISPLKSVEIVEDAIILHDGLAETRIPLTKIESVTTRLFKVAVTTPMRTYEFEASVGLMGRKRFDAWVARLQEAVA